MGRMPVEFEGRGAEPKRLDRAESFQTFGTIIFAIDRMRLMIIPLLDGADLSAWFALVPEVYRDDVRRIIKEVEPVFLRQQVTARLVAEFVGRLHDRIVAEVKPRPPAEKQPCCMRFRVGDVLLPPIGQVTPPPLVMEVIVIVSDEEQWLIENEICESVDNGGYRHFREVV
jgi:hypothetical protein